MPRFDDERIINAIFEIKLENNMKPIDLNGRAVYKARAKTLPDDIVMNRVKYPADEIEKGYRSLENKIAPLGHPNVSGWSVSAADPEGLNRHYVGAWNANVDRVLEDNGKYRIHHDIMLDIETAKQTENGRRVLKAFENGSPIHTSTGLKANPEWVEHEEYDWIAHNLQFDHNAILLDISGAATPEDGVGVFVNHETGEKKHLLINSLSSKEQSVNTNPSKDDPKMTTPADPKPTEKTVTNAEPAKPATPAMPPSAPSPTITMTQEELTKAISSAVQTALNERDERAAADEKKGLVEKIVARNMLSQDLADKLDLATLRELANNSGVKEPATPVNGAPAKPDANPGDLTLENMFKGYSIHESYKPEATTH